MLSQVIKKKLYCIHATHLHIIITNKIEFPMFKQRCLSSICAAKKFIDFIVYPMV